MSLQSPQRRALVAGGTGRVGGAIARRLGGDGWRVLAAGTADGEYWGRVLVKSRGGEPPVEQTQGNVRMQLALETTFAGYLPVSGEFPTRRLLWEDRRG